MRYVFEVATEIEGDVRVYVVEFLRREADDLLVKFHGLEAALPISAIRDWCAVDERTEDAVMLALGTRKLITPARMLTFPPTREPLEEGSIVA